MVPPPTLRVLNPFQQQGFVEPFNAVMAAQARLDEARFEDRLARVCVADAPENPSSEKNGPGTLEIGGYHGGHPLGPTLGTGAGV